MCLDLDADFPGVAALERLAGGQRVVDAVALRDAILSQRQKVLDAERPAASSESTGEATEILTEIRDILARIAAQGR